MRIQGGGGGGQMGEDILGPEVGSMKEDKRQLAVAWLKNWNKRGRIHKKHCTTTYLLFFSENLERS